MICPHCGKEIKSTPEEKIFRRKARYITSGRAKLRSSVDRMGLCIEDGCDTKVVGKSARCEHHKLIYRKNYHKNYDAKRRSRKAGTNG